MANYNGAATFILVGEESVFKTAVTPIKDLGVTATVDTSENNNPIEIRGTGGREPCAYVAGNYDASMSLDGTLNSGAILELFFGQATDTETTGDYKHTFVDRGTLEVANDIKSYTVGVNLDGASNDFSFTYAGVKCNTLDLTIEVNQVIGFSSELICSTVVTDTTVGTQVKTCSKPLSFSQFTLSTGTEGGEVAVGQVQRVNLSFNNNIDSNDIRELGSREAAALIVKQLEVSGEFTIKFQNKTEAELFYGGTSPQDTLSDIGLVFSGNNGLTLGSGRVELYFKFLNCIYESLGRTIAQDGVVEEIYSFKAGNIDDAFFVDGVATYF